VPKNKTQLAMGIALEWDQLVSAHQALKHHYIPLTSLVSRALDLEAADARGDHSTREGVISMLMRHFTTDTLLCWAPEQNIHDPTYMNWEEEGKNLRLMQADIATPIISYLTSRVWPGVEINPVLDPNSILPAPQPAMTQEIIREWVSGLKAYELAGLERAVLASKSLLVGVRLLVEWSQEFQELRKENGDGQKFGIEQAAQASSMEVDWQTGMWGEVEDTHDVEREDLRRQLGGVVLLVGGESA
jgi:ATP synthase F1 complex assembly factor 2